MLNQTLCLGAEFHNRNAGCVVYVQGRFHQTPECVFQLDPFVGFQLYAALDFFARQAAFRCDKALGKLIGTHFQGEYRYRHVFLYGGVTGYIERKGGFTHRRAGGQDNKVTVLPALSNAVYGGITRRNAGKAGCALHVLQFAQDRIDYGANVVEITLYVVADGCVNLGLGVVNEVIHVGGLVE